ncbi:uncharacterized protein LOC129247133 isoform X1 [Anastrepha obliqua]|uniref:uncharacterized protein LOC129247133 isoform X1 n=2 Tax=Anastrepha obliqua TaxID=95512 RepID=UPI00240A64AA|nr:uncharacterized protein LOC129247133 isoform X1 [Anastrepha obliqua]
MYIRVQCKLATITIFLAAGIFIIFTHTPMTTRALRSTKLNTLIDDPLYDMDELVPFESKRSMPCDSCGNECTSACGTKNFRTCCFNYLRKRNDPNAMKSFSNKRLIDFILLQGRAAMYTLDEHHRNGNVGDDEREESGGGGSSGIVGDENTFADIGNGHRIRSAHFHHRIV